MDPLPNKLLWIILLKVVGSTTYSNPTTPRYVDLDLRIRGSHRHLQTAAAQSTCATQPMAARRPFGDGGNRAVDVHTVRFRHSERER